MVIVLYPFDCYLFFPFISTRAVCFVEQVRFPICRVRPSTVGWKYNFVTRETALERYRLSFLLFSTVHRKRRISDTFWTGSRGRRVSVSLRRRRDAGRPESWLGIYVMTNSREYATSTAFVTDIRDPRTVIVVANTGCLPGSGDK